MKNLCKKCDKRYKCTKLCKKAEEYVNQDCSKQQEFIPPAQNMNHSQNTNWGEVNLDNSTVLKNVIINLYNDGMKTDEIAYHVPCTLRHIQRIIKEYKDKNKKKTT